MAYNTQLSGAARSAVSERPKGVTSTACYMATPSTDSDDDQTHHNPLIRDGKPLAEFLALMFREHTVINQNSPTVAGKVGDIFDRFLSDLIQG